MSLLYQRKCCRPAYGRKRGRVYIQSKHVDKTSRGSVQSERFFSDRRASRLRAIPRPGGHKAAGVIDYPEVPAMFGVIITRRIATLYELQTIYSLDDAVDLYEIVAVNNYNEWRQTEAVKKK